MRIFNNIKPSYRTLVNYIVPLGLSVGASAYFAYVGEKQHIESKNRLETIQEISEKAYTQKNYITHLYDSIKTEEPLFFKQEFWENAKEEILQKAQYKHQKQIDMYKVRQGSSTKH